MNTRIKNLKLTITISDADTDEKIWTDYSTGDTESLRGMFESAEMNMGTMERNLEMVLERDYKVEDDGAEDDHNIPYEPSTEDESKQDDGE